MENNVKKKVEILSWGVRWVSICERQIRWNFLLATHGGTQVTPVLCFQEKSSINQCI